MAGSNHNSSYYDLFGDDSYTPTSKQVTPVVIAAQVPKQSPFYQKQDFITTKLAELYGSNPSKRDLKQFNDYLNSEQGQKDWLAHEKQESSKYLASFDAYAENARKPILVAKMPTFVTQQVVQTPTSQKQEITSSEQPKSQIVPRTVRSNEDWNKIARQHGFADMAAVRQWQSQNGLIVDGKLGNNSLKKLQELKAIAEQQAADQQVTNQEIVIQPTNTPSTETIVTYQQSQMVDPAFKYQRPNERFFRYHFNGTKDVKMGNNTYPVFVTRSESISKNNKWGLKGDESYAYDPATGRVRRLQENIFGMVQDQGDLKTPKWVEGEDWIDISDLPTPYRGGVHKNKQGGTMNRIKYFQQGGPTQQQGAQDIQQQVVALVQAAMQGDEKANQTVNQIMEAAKQGDQQAVKLAQLIQAVVQQMKGQATSAKWGSKLSYIRSLKYAKGGKACVACEKGSPIKVEEKSCGGKAKKAKKRYFGGWL